MNEELEYTLCKLLRRVKTFDDAIVLLQEEYASQGATEWLYGNVEKMQLLRSKVVEEVVEIVEEM